MAVYRSMPIWLYIGPWTYMAVYKSTSDPNMMLGLARYPQLKNYG